MGKSLISPYIHLTTPLEKQELFDEYVDDCIENNEPIPDEDTFFLNQRFSDIQKKGYSYWDKEESIDCKELTKKFVNLQHSYIEMGLIAWELKYKKLYKKEYKNFKDYCEKALKLCIWQVNRLINASRIALLLIENNFDYIPTCESQARVLNPYTDEEILVYWGEICEKYEGREYELTAQKIWCEIRQMRIDDGDPVKESKWRNIKVRAELYRKLVNEAIAEHLSLIEFLEYCVGEYDYPIIQGKPLSPNEEKVISELEKQWVNSS
jgi:hypothetical protein